MTQTPAQSSQPTYLRSSCGGGGSSSLDVSHTSSRLHANTLLGKQVNQQWARAAVALRVEGRLAVLVLLYTVQIDVEEVGRVKRASLRLGVELCAEDGSRLVDHT